MHVRLPALARQPVIDVMCCRPCRRGGKLLSFASRLIGLYRNGAAAYCFGELCMPRR